MYDNSVNEKNPIDDLVYKQLSIFGNGRKKIDLEQLCYYLLDAFNVYREVNGFPKLTMQQFIDSQPTVKHDGSGPLVPESFEKEATEALDKLVRLGLIKQTPTGDYELNGVPKIILSDRDHSKPIPYIDMDRVEELWKDDQNVKDNDPEC